MTLALSRRPVQKLAADCVMAVLVVAATLVSALGFHRLSGIAPSVSLFSCVVMLVAWIRGVVPAIFATALTDLAFDYFFLEPRYTLGFERSDLPQLVFFAAGALLVAWLCESKRRSKRALREIKSAARANEVSFAEAQRELQLTIDTIPAMISTYDPDGIHSFVNKARTDYTGMKLGDAVAARGAAMDGRVRQPVRRRVVCRAASRLPRGSGRTMTPLRPIGVETYLTGCF
ncbi:MAG TPA: DUF4118 domain-containing protein [Xanthobacteraceae bacterium]|nr:DUF4118 domain-containing protein [Xanthobacteraceae bacterium]